VDGKEGGELAGTARQLPHSRKRQAPGTCGNGPGASLVLLDVTPMSGRGPLDGELARSSPDARLLGRLEIPDFVGQLLPLGGTQGLTQGTQAGDHVLPSIGEVDIFRSLR